MSSTTPWPIQWSAEFEIGIPIVDVQHKRLVEIANNIYLLKSSPKRWWGALDDLMAYIQYHFSLEERLMGEADFDGLAAHRLAHESLAEQVADLWQARATATPEQALDLLMGWVLNHILTCDRELRFLAGKV